MVKQAGELLRASGLNYRGNIEGYDIYKGTTDVVVCDGFVGNVTLKVIEGVAGTLLGALHEGINASLLARVGAAFMAPVLRRTRHLFDYRAYGGALLLGINGICVVSHGKSDARAVCNALLVAERSVRGRVIEHMRDTVESLMPAPESGVPLAG
jgi:glycerol-3-phosphate acyltransferase PlsX